MTEPQHPSRDPFDRPVILLHHVVEVFALTQFDVKARIFVDIMNGRRIGSTLVNGDLLRHIVQADCPFQKAPCCGLISPGSEQNFLVALSWIGDVVSTRNG